MNIQHWGLYDRVKKLEEKNKPNKRNQLTLNRRILLYKFSGMLEGLKDQFSTQSKLVDFLCDTIDGDRTNIKKALAKLETKESILLIDNNYEFLRDYFEKHCMATALNQLQATYNLLRK